MKEDRELSAINATCEKRNVTLRQILEESVAPLQERISGLPDGELIGAIVRAYSPCLMDSGGQVGIELYTPHETVYVGRKGAETTFPRVDYLSSAFLLGVNRPCSLNKRGVSENVFADEKDGSFNLYSDGIINPNEVLKLLFFRERHPEIFVDAYAQNECFGGSPTAFQILKPRLEFYIGNEETQNFLGQRAEFWMYPKLASLLDASFLLTEDVRVRLAEDQMHIFRRLMSLIQAINFSVYNVVDGYAEEPLLTPERDSKLREQISKVIDPAAMITIYRIYAPELVRIAVARGYDQSNFQAEQIELSPGIIANIDFRAFFRAQKELLNL